MEVKNYSNGEITIKWDASKCIHSAICIKGLPTVFNSRARPWIKMDGDSSEQIKKQVLSCPSGALSIDQEKTKFNYVGKQCSRYSNPKWAIDGCGHYSSNR